MPLSPKQAHDIHEDIFNEIIVEMEDRIDDKLVQHSHLGPHGVDLRVVAEDNDFFDLNTLRIVNKIAEDYADAGWLVTEKDMEPTIYFFTEYRASGDNF